MKPLLSSAKPRTARKPARKPMAKALKQGRNDSELLLSAPANAGRMRAAIKHANAGGGTAWDPQARSQQPASPLHRIGKTGTAA